MTKRISRLLVGLFATAGGLIPATVFAALFSSVLPTSRSAEVGTPVTAFATIINTGPGTATGCAISPVTPVAADFLYQTTDPATNALIGAPDTPADIGEGLSQSFVFAFTPSAAFAPTDVELDFSCTNAAPAQTISGVNTLLLSASTTPVPDVIALSTTAAVDIPAATANAAFAVATVNVGTQGVITASADTGSVSLPVTVSLCETDPPTGTCINPTVPTTAPVTTTIAANATPTFAFFLNSAGTIPFDPAVNRLRVLFTDDTQTVRGSTSVALSSDVVVLPDLTGTYVGSGSVTNTGCLDPADNITISYGVDLLIDNQSGQDFSGSVVSSTQIQGFTVEERGTFQGTVDAQGNVNGTVVSELFVNNVFDSSSSGTFTGTFSNGTLNVSISTQDTSGDTCSSTGSFSVTRQ
jgi:hypothetical protein